MEAEGDDDSDWRLPDPNAEKANQKQGKSLEALLASKNKRLLDELTRFRVRVSTQSGHYALTSLLRFSMAS